MFNEFTLGVISKFSDWMGANGYSDAKDPQAQFDYQRYVQETKSGNDMVILSWQMAVQQAKDILDTSRKLI